MMRIALYVGLLAIVLRLIACAELGPADRADLARDAANIEICQEQGRACKADGGTNCYAVYDACMNDAGLR